VPQLPFSGSTRAARLCAALTATAVVMLTLPSLSGARFDSSGYCAANNNCYWSQNWYLSSYGSSGASDRGAYGYFHGDLTRVQSQNANSFYAMCAGAKSASSGDGYNESPMGEPCSGGAVTFFQASSARTSGYATIINHDVLSGGGWYADGTRS
jgi:hypothetical protein